MSPMPMLSSDSPLANPNLTRAWGSLESILRISGWCKRDTGASTCNALTGSCAALTGSCAALDGVYWSKGQNTFDHHLVLVFVVCNAQHDIFSCDDGYVAYNIYKLHPIHMDRMQQKIAVETAAPRCRQILGYNATSAFLNVTRLPCQCIAPMSNKTGTVLAYKQIVLGEPAVMRVQLRLACQAHPKQKPLTHCEHAQASITKLPCASKQHHLWQPAAPSW